MTDTPDPTPSDLRTLVAAARDLAARTIDLAARLQASDDENVRRRAFPVEEAACGDLTRFADDLETEAGKLARIRAARGAQLCPADWGACPEHGATLRATGGESWCTEPGCVRRWNHDRLGLPCAEPIAVLVTDTEGTETGLCAGHAIDARTRIIDATFRPVDQG